MLSITTISNLFYTLLDLIPNKGWGFGSNNVRHSELKRALQNIMHISGSYYELLGVLLIGNA